MRASTCVSVVWLVFISVTPAVAVGRPDFPHPQRVYTLDGAPKPPVQGPLGVPDAVEEHPILVNLEAVVENPPVLAIDLPSFPPLEAVRTRFVTYRPDWKSWIGTLRYAGSEAEGSGYIHLGFHGAQLTALIHFEGERYRIVGGAWESHRLVRLSDDLSLPSCGLEDSPGLAGPHDSDGAKIIWEPEPTVAAVTSTRIDVLALYPKVFFSFGPAAEAGVFNFIEDSISLANDAFVNSQVNAYYNLTAIVPLTGAQPPATGIFDALNWLTNRTPQAEASKLRDAFGADVVTIYVPFIWSTNAPCGVANLPQNNGTFLSAEGSRTITVLAEMGDRAFTANRDGCGLGDFTLGHEIGHNYGMRHDNVGTTGPHLYSYGRGHSFTVSGLPKATVMGCTCGVSPKPPCSSDIANSVCNRISYFSDPNITYQGQATGTSDRNNALVARLQAAGYANFRQQSTNTPPFASFNVSCSGRTCTFNASSSVDNAPIPTTGYWWDFGDGTTGTGKIVNHTYSSGTFFWVHLVVKDAGGQTDVTLNSASPQ